MSPRQSSSQSHANGTLKQVVAGSLVAVLGLITICVTSPRPIFGSDDKDCEKRIESLQRELGKSDAKFELLNEENTKLRARLNSTALNSDDRDQLIYLLRSHDSRLDRLEHPQTPLQRLEPTLQKP